MTNPMVPIYAALVRKGVKKLENVPARLREDVKKLLEEEKQDGDQTVQP